MPKYRVRMWKVGEVDKSKFSEDNINANNEAMLRQLMKTMGYEIQILGMEGKEIPDNPLQAAQAAEMPTAMTPDQMQVYNPAIMTNPGAFMPPPKPPIQYNPMQGQAQPGGQMPPQYAPQPPPKKDPILFEDGDVIFKLDPNTGKMYKKSWVEVDPAEYRINPDNKIEKRDWVEIKAKS